MGPRDYADIKQGPQEEKKVTFLLLLSVHGAVQQQ